MPKLASCIPMLNGEWGFMNLSESYWILEWNLLVERQVVCNFEVCLFCEWIQFLAAFCGFLFILVVLSWEYEVWAWWVINWWSWYAKEVKMKWVFSVAWTCTILDWKVGIKSVVWSSGSCIALLWLKNLITYLVWGSRDLFTELPLNFSWILISIVSSVQEDHHII